MNTLEQPKKPTSLLEKYQLLLEKMNFASSSIKDQIDATSKTTVDTNVSGLKGLELMARLKEIASTRKAISQQLEDLQLKYDLMTSVRIPRIAGKIADLQNQNPNFQTEGVTTSAQETANSPSTTSAIVSYIQTPSEDKENTALKLIPVLAQNYSLDTGAEELKKLSLVLQSKELEGQEKVQQINAFKNNFSNHLATLPFKEAVVSAMAMIEHLESTAEGITLMRKTETSDRLDQTNPAIFVAMILKAGKSTIKSEIIEQQLKSIIDLGAPEITAFIEKISELNGSPNLKKALCDALFNIALVESATTDKHLTNHFPFPELSDESGSGLEEDEVEAMSQNEMQQSLISFLNNCNGDELFEQMADEKIAITMNAIQSYDLDSATQILQEFYSYLMKLNQVNLSDLFEGSEKYLEADTKKLVSRAQVSVNKFVKMLLSALKMNEMINERNKVDTSLIQNITGQLAEKLKHLPQLAASTQSNGTETDWEKILAEDATSEDAMDQEILPLSTEDEEDSEEDKSAYYSQMYSGNPNAFQQQSAEDEYDEDEEFYDESDK